MEVDLETVATIALLPLALPGATGLTALLAGAFGAGRRALAATTAGGLAATAVSAGLLVASPCGAPVPDLALDAYTYLFVALLAGAGVVATVLMHADPGAVAGDPEVPACLVPFAVLGMSVLVASASLVTLFLGLETLTVSLYPLIAARRGPGNGLEAAIKYLVLASVASGFLLLGGALGLGATGTLDLARMMRPLASDKAGALAVAAPALLFSGLAFKLAVVPFHLWVADVFQGAPAAVAGLLATGSKGAVLLVLVRIFGHAPPERGEPWFATIAALAVATMTAGNLLALFQKRLKRMLAWSSTAHVGYLLLALLVLPAGGATAAGFYLVGYVLASLAAFGAPALLAGAAGSEPAHIDDLRGLARRHPLLAAVVAVAMLSLGGLPLTVGFISKFLLFGAAVRQGLYALAIAAVLNSGVSLYYYLRVVVAMYMREPPDTPPLSGDRDAAAHAPHSRGLPAAGLAALVVVAAAILALGIHPWPAVEAVALGTSALVGSRVTLPRTSCPRPAGGAASTSDREAPQTAGVFANSDSNFPGSSLE